MADMNRAMKYNLFMFDLDDTLLDFKASEELCFHSSLKSMGIESEREGLFEHYQRINRKLWDEFEQAKISKEALRIERFKELFLANDIAHDPNIASHRYLEALPSSVVLVEHAKEVCEHLSSRAEIGIVTNGIHQVQIERIKNSGLAPYFSFIAVSEECGHPKPDSRFFDYSAKMARSFTKESTLVVGDRLETDVMGASNYGLASCWFNPEEKPLHLEISPTYTIAHLSELESL